MKKILSQHLFNVILKSTVSFLPFVTFLFLSGETEVAFNTFSYHFAVFNILFGFFGLPLYQYFMVTGERSNLKKIYTTNSVSIQVFLALSICISSVLYIVGFSVAVIIPSALVYSYIIGLTAFRTRRGYIKYEMAVNFAFFLVLLLGLIFFGYGSSVGFLFATISLAIFGTLLFPARDLELVNPTTSTAGEKLEIGKYVAVSSLGSLVSYGDILIAVQFLPASDAYIYIWVNRALLGGSILCLGLNNYLMAKKETFDSRSTIAIFMAISIFIGVIACLAAYVALEIILKVNAPLVIYLLMFTLIIVKYISVIPSVFMMHAKLQTQRILSTLYAGVFYLATAYTLISYSRLTLLTLTLAVLSYHSVLLMRNVYSIAKNYS